MNTRLVEQRASEECGCPEEEWVIDKLVVVLHFEPDGSGEITIDAGEWEIQERHPAQTMEELRSIAFARIAALPMEA